MEQIFRWRSGHFLSSIERPIETHVQKPFAAPARTERSLDSESLARLPERILASKSQTGTIVVASRQDRADPAQGLLGAVAVGLCAEQKMLGFLFHRKREEVKRVLHGRVNRAHARTIAVQNIRGATRQIFNEVIWALPCESPEKADFSQLFPAICRDLCTQGIGVFLTAPIVEPHMIIGLRDESEPRFLACSVKHCASMGYGFYHVGLFPDEVMTLRREQVEAMCQALGKYPEHEACCETVAAGSGP